MTVMTEGPKVSRYLAAGAPQTCFLPPCHKAFEHECFRGKDGHFYCSAACAEIGGKLDMSHVEELRPKLPATLPTPRQKLLSRG
jgi:hypothetical protein